ARQEHALQLFLERGKARARIAHLAFGEFARLRIARHLLRGGEVAFRAAIFRELVHDRLDLRALLRELAEVVEVVHVSRVGEPRVDFLQPRVEAREPGGDGCLHGSRVASRSSTSGKSVSIACASASRSLSGARDSAWDGWCRNLLASPRAS